MCGGGPMINQNRDYEGIIMLSHNGVNWRNVFRTAANFNIYNDWVTEVAWDARDELFYANSSYSDNNGSSWISSDGYSWSYASGQSFWQHTNIVGWGDGIVGYDPEHNLLITPDDEVFQTISMYARCTAYMGGIWLAGGRNAFSGDSLTVSSIDSRKTWQPVTFGAIGMTGNYAITCIIGGPMEDFG